MSMTVGAAIGLVHILLLKLWSYSVLHYHESLNVIMLKYLYRYPMFCIW